MFDKTSIYYEITIVLKEKNQVFHWHHISCPDKSGTVEKTPVLNPVMMTSYWWCHVYNTSKPILQMSKSMKIT